MNWRHLQHKELFLSAYYYGGIFTVGTGKELMAKASSGGGSGKELVLVLVLVESGGKSSGGVNLHEDEDLEVKLRRIMKNVPVRVSDTSWSSAGSGDFHQLCGSISWPKCGWNVDILIDGFDPLATSVASMFAFFENTADWDDSAEFICPDHYMMKQDEMDNNLMLQNLLMTTKNHG